MIYILYFVLSVFNNKLKFVRTWQIRSQFKLSCWSTFSPQNGQNIYPCVSLLHPPIYFSRKPHDFVLFGLRLAVFTLNWKFRSIKYRKNGLQFTGFLDFRQTWGYKLYFYSSYCPHILRFWLNKEVNNWKTSVLLIFLIHSYKLSFYDYVYHYTQETLINWKFTSVFSAFHTLLICHVFTNLNDANGSSTSLTRGHLLRLEHDL